MVGCGHDRDEIKSMNAAWDSLATNCHHVMYLLPLLRLLILAKIPLVAKTLKLVPATRNAYERCSSIALAETVPWPVSVLLPIMRA